MDGIPNSRVSMKAGAVQDGISPKGSSRTLGLLDTENQFPGITAWITSWLVTTLRVPVVQRLRTRHSVRKAEFEIDECIRPQVLVVTQMLFRTALRVPSVDVVCAFHKMQYKPKFYTWAGPFHHPGPEVG